MELLVFNIVDASVGDSVVQIFEDFEIMDHQGPIMADMMNYSYSHSEQVHYRVRVCFHSCTHC